MGLNKPIVLQLKECTFWGKQKANNVVTENFNIFSC